jgi:threonine aldolase
VHKAGIAAAAALVALDTLVERLADDHRRARELGALLRDVPGLEVEPAEIETNIVLVDVGGTELYPDEFLRLLAERGVLGLERDTSRVRFVTHRLIGDAEVSRAAEIVAALAAEQRPQV